MTVNLNAEQRAAAETLDRPVLVTAGAGSGKTRMLTQRFVNAVTPGAVEGWGPAGIDEIVAITFTDKAAGEIAERVRLALRAAGEGEAARGIGDAWISTIHGLCSRLLRRHAFEAGIDPLFSVPDTVRTGELRERAFESAARKLLSEGPGAAELFDAYPYDTLFSAAMAVTRELAVIGCRIDAIELEPAEQASALLGEARALFERGMTTCELGYSGSSSDPFDHVGRCEELLGRCSELVSAEREEPELLSELLLALEAYKPVKKLKGLEELASELSAGREDLMGRAAAALVAPYCLAFRALVARYAESYSASKAEAGLLDFDDLQVRTVELLERRPEISARYREQFRVVMIDEFQDTDALQLRLVEALSDGDLCTVGDEKQSIYRFRGADVGVYRAHRVQMELEGALVAELDVNYRSHPDLLDFVNDVFGSEQYFGSALLRLRAPSEGRAGAFDAVLGDGPRIEALFVDSKDADGAGGRAAEAATLAGRVAELCAAGVAPRDIAVLMRAYTHAHAYAEALSAVGIRAVVIGGSRFFRLPETAVMRALNRAIANVEDGLALGALLASDFVPMSSDALAILRFGTGSRDGRSLWTLLNERRTELAPADREAADRLIDVLERARTRVGRLPLAEVLLLAVEEAGWDLRLLAGGNLGRDAFANVLKFARQATAFEESAGSGPAGFARHLDSKERLGDTETPASLADDGSDAVRIMSIHASKGLEFPIVIVPGLADRGRSDSLAVRVSRRVGGLALALRTPAGVDGEARGSSAWFSAFTQEAAEASAEEDARVLYVACTRAREMLLVSGAMNLRPAKGTSAKHHLARLSRVLGLEIPISGPSDRVTGLPGSGTRCQVRVIDAAEFESPADVGTCDADGEGAFLPPAGTTPLEDKPRRAAPERLSYTQLSEFEHCPRRFWARRVFGIRPADFGLPGASTPLQFGNALHAALRLVEPDGAPPPHERIEAIGRYHELGEGDVVRLMRAVDRYCASGVGRRAVAGETVRRESPFSLSVGGRFLLTGSIDLYSRSGDAALVVDYKSGETGDPEELADRYRLQAECYALAALRDKCGSVEVVFVRPEVELAGDGEIQSVAFGYSASDGEQIERDLVHRYGEIEASAFEPRPSAECYHCDVPGGLCPQRAAGCSAG